MAVLEVEVREEREGREGAVASLVEGREREGELGAALAWERLEGRNRREGMEARWAVRPQGSTLFPIIVATIPDQL